MSGAYSTMSDSQLRKSINDVQMSAAQPTRTSSRPSKRTAARAAAKVQQQQQQEQQLQQQRHAQQNRQANANINTRQRGPLPTQPQAYHSTYASRMRTGVTLLVQPIIQQPNAAAASRATARRGAAISYIDPGSGDEFPDAGALDSEDSEFQANGGLRTMLRRQGGVITNTGGRTGTPQPPQQQQQQQPGSGSRAELDQSYLGKIPPSRFIKAKAVAPTAHSYPFEHQLEEHAQLPAALVPVRIEFDTDTHRIRDCFVWNLHEKLIRPEAFAKIFCTDLDLPANPWVDMITNQIRAQLEDQEVVASLAMDIDVAMEPAPEDGRVEEVPECRVILEIDVQIATYHLVDYIEWDLLSPLTPEAFATTLSADLGLSGEAIPLIAHAVHEELVKHKKDALEWGVLAGDGQHHQDDAVLKDRTGLGHVWAGRAPKDGRGPKKLRSVWRDWADAEEYKTTFEVLSAEEVERREIERERASRRLRRETSKFQNNTRSRRR